MRTSMGERGASVSSEPGAVKRKAIAQPRDHVPDSFLHAAVELHRASVLRFFRELRERGVDAAQRGVVRGREAPDLVPAAQPETAREVPLRSEAEHPIREPDGAGHPDHDEGHEQLDPDQEGREKHGCNVEAQLRELGTHRALVEIGVEKGHRPLVHHDGQQEIRAPSPVSARSSPPLA